MSDLESTMSRRTDDISIDQIMAELKTQTTTITQQSVRLEKIETLLVENAIQNTKIKEIQIQLNTIWTKYNQLSGPGGIISEIKSHQANCPKPTLDTSFNRLWWAFGLLVSVYAGTVGLLIQHIHSIVNQIGKP